ncbi:hypothetical protein EVAR_63448_1 [Eumeta japonica]|uniref:Uncharacterized protein n=1 Tax=Eumeta variegata TaxID=151549 RepID=A0A4C1YUX5_EUMVA|nr:hypothetical protein EVAR_63448_1 [Eumeta japonica]
MSNKGWVAGGGGEDGVWKGWRPRPPRGRAGLKPPLAMEEQIYFKMIETFTQLASSVANEMYAIPLIGDL